MRLIDLKKITINIKNKFNNYIVKKENDWS